jgi:hypothetical protein
MSAGARVGRAVCLLLGVLSLAGAVVVAARDVAAPGDEAGASEGCGAVVNPDDSLSSDCSLALQSRAQGVGVIAVVGAAWMIGAAAFSMAGRAQQQPVPEEAAPAPPEYAAASADTGYPTGARPSIHSQTPWAHPRGEERGGAYGG